MGSAPSKSTPSCDVHELPTSQNLTLARLAHDVCVANALARKYQKASGGDGIGFSLFYDSADRYGCHTAWCALYDN